MDVRLTAKTTLTVAVLFFGTGLLLDFYAGLMLEDFSGNMPRIFFTDNRLFVTFHQIGTFYPNFMYVSFYLVMLACIIDGILNKHVALDLLSSLIGYLLFVAIGIIQLSLIFGDINILVLWGAFLVLQTTALYLTFTKLLRTRLIMAGAFNSYYNSSIKGVYQSIAKIVEIEFSGDDTYKGNVVDRIAIYAAASLLAIFTIISLISLMVFAYTHGF